jgi:hypothetical protein
MSPGICPSCGRRCWKFANNVKCDTVEKRRDARWRITKAEREQAAREAAAISPVRL